MVGLLVLAATAVTVAVRGIGAAEPVTETVGWLSTLGFDLNLRLDGFAVLMSLVVRSVILASNVAYSSATSRSVSHWYSST